MNDEGRYSNVSRRMWGDERFCALSAPKPNAQTLWIRLLTGPELGCVPGLFSVREGGLADALHWPLASFRKCWEEIATKQMAFADWRAGIVWVPKSLDHNPPRSPNVVLSWKVSLTELPESNVKAQAMASLKSRVEAMGPPWAESWRKASTKASPKICPNQEQEQEQKQEQEQEGLSRERALDLFGASFVPGPDELPAGWEPSAENVALAAAFGLTIDDEAGEYQAWCRSKRRVCGNWQADFELWLRRSKKFARRGNGRTGAAFAESPAERRTRQQLEHIADLEAQELAAKGVAQ